MENFLKALIIAVVIVVISIVCYGLYFASQISAVYPPLKKYNYKLTALKLQDLILTIDNADTNLTCIITDTVGLKSDLAYHMDISIKRQNINYSFHIKYEDEKSVWSNSINTEVGLIGAFDTTHKVGGYQTKEIEVKNLIDIFEKEFISKLNREILDKEQN